MLASEDKHVSEQFLLRKSECALNMERAEAVATLRQNHRCGKCSDGHG